MYDFQLVGQTSDLPPQARHDHDFEVGPSDKFCPACQPGSYATYTAKHRADRHDGKWTIPDDLGGGQHRPYLGRMVSERGLGVGHWLGLPVGTSRQEHLAELADQFPKNIYFIAPEVLW